MLTIPYLVFLDPSTYTYYNVTMQRNGEPPKAYPGEYSTDLVTNRSLGFLDEAIPTGNPFFLGIAPIAPHSQTINSVFWPAVPADRHKDLLPELKAPRTANFNPDTVSGTRPTGAPPRKSSLRFFPVANQDHFFAPHTAERW